MTNGLTKGQQLLAALTIVIGNYDPMCLGRDGLDQYEIEAVSILARLNELHAGMIERPESEEIARAVVIDTFNMWFGQGTRLQNLSSLSNAVLDAYVSVRAD